MGAVCVPIALFDPFLSFGPYFLIQHEYLNDFGFPAANVVVVLLQNRAAFILRPSDDTFVYIFVLAAWPLP